MEELLDHLVDVGDAGRLLDLAERRLVRRHHLLLALDDVDVQRVVERVRHHVLLQGLLGLLAEVALRLQHDVAPRLLALLHPRVHLLARVHRATPLAQLLVARLPLLADEPLQPAELALRDVLRVRRVVRHEEELLVVVLLRLERRLDRAQLVVEVDALLLQPLDDLVVRLADRLRLVVLDHRLVQPVLERADLAHQRVRLVRRPRAVLPEVAQLVLELRQLLLLRLVPVDELVLLLAQQRQLRLDLGDLGVVEQRGVAARAAAALLVHRRERRAQVLVLAPQRVAHLLVVLQRQLGLLVERLAVALEEVEAVLQVGELVRNGGRRRGLAHRKIGGGVGSARGATQLTLHSISLATATRRSIELTRDARAAPRRGRGGDAEREAEAARNSCAALVDA